MGWGWAPVALLRQAGILGSGWRSWRRGGALAAANLLMRSPYERQTDRLAKGCSDRLLQQRAPGLGHLQPCLIDLHHHPGSIPGGHFAVLPQHGSGGGQLQPAQDALPELVQFCGFSVVLRRRGDRSGWGNRWGCLGTPGGCRWWRGGRGGWRRQTVAGRSGTVRGG